MKEELIGAGLAAMMILELIVLLLNVFQPSPCLKVISILDSKGKGLKNFKTDNSSIGTYTFASRLEFKDVAPFCQFPDIINKITEG